MIRMKVKTDPTKMDVGDVSSHYGTTAPLPGCVLITNNDPLCKLRQ